MKKLNWNKDQVEYLEYNYPNLSDNQLSINLQKSPNALRIKASRLNLKKTSSVYRNSLELSPVEEQVVLGGLMGDLHCRLTHTSKNARLELGHGSEQKEYLNYKINLLQRLKWMTRKSKDGRYHCESKAFPCLNIYHKLFYSNSKKTINNAILDKINTLGILIWYLDDGSYHSRDKSSRLHTNCFTFEEHIILKEWFEDKLKIFPRLHKSINDHGNCVYILSFPVSETIKLHNLFKNFEIPECMKYKFYFNQQSHLPKSIPGVLAAHN